MTGFFIRTIAILILLGFAAGVEKSVTSIAFASDNEEIFSVKDFGAAGTGKTLDTEAINKAIGAASAAGGGTVFFPAGTYLSFSIHLKSNITLYLDNGATILAAEPKEGFGAYDLPEPSEWDMYQDFGHSHWQNSLIWGTGLENVAILGQGKIDGKGLSRRSPGPRGSQSGNVPQSLGGNNAKGEIPLGGNIRPDQTNQMNGLGTKAIALKATRNVTIRDVTIFQGGHFALLATGVDNLTIDNVKVDTNRDGFDIDSCRNVRISNSHVNSPNDDAIVLKSSYALGSLQATENVTITNSQVSAYDLGTLLDGTFKKTQKEAPDKDGVTGRIKFGTESNGGFKNITISNCVFDHSRGLALETVDGGNIEDITITAITMRDLTSAPIFLRIGSRLRGPKGNLPGAIRRVNISNIVVSDAEPRFASIIAGIPGHDVEDVSLSNIRIAYRGGVRKEDAVKTVPENETGYPEPSMFGTLPAYGFFIRHARGITLDNIKIGYQQTEERPAFLLEDVKGIDLFRIDAQQAAGASMFVLKNVENFSVMQSKNIKDRKLPHVDQKEF